MIRYRLTGDFDGGAFVPDPAGGFVMWRDVAPFLSNPVMAALDDYAAKLAAWDARPQEGDAAHAFGDAGLVDGLAAALRDARGKGGQG